MMDIEEAKTVSGERGSSLPFQREKQNCEATKKVFSMRKGEGQDSYSKNSGIQGFFVNRLLNTDFSEVLKILALPRVDDNDGDHSRPVVVADLGCASGSNSINSVSFIIEKLRKRFECESSAPQPEFQAFFNDVPTNDFNNLFQHLSTRPKNFLAAGVPGSYLGRLFARSSVYIFFSTFCVHFLSKIPDTVLDRNSPACNKGRFCIHSASPSVVAAYREQALSDMSFFLHARARELVPGGLLYVMCPGRSPTNPHKYLDDPLVESYYDCLDRAFNDLVAKGVIMEEQRDMMNLSVFFYSVADMKEAADLCASDFRVHSIKLVEMETNYIDIWETDEPSQLSKYLTGFFQAVFAEQLDTQIGKEVSELYWQRFEKLIAEKITPGLLEAYRQGKPHNLACGSMAVMALIRN